MQPDPTKHSRRHAPPPTLPAGPAYVVAAVGGTVLWLATAAVSGRSEAWDAPLYWTAAYPLAVVLAALLGALSPLRAWRWGLTIMLVQALTLAVTAADFGLLPMGLVVFALLALPLVGASLLAAALRGRLGARR